MQTCTWQRSHLLRKPRERPLNIGRSRSAWRSLAWRRWGWASQCFLCYLYVCLLFWSQTSCVIQLFNSSNIIPLPVHFLSTSCPLPVPQVFVRLCFPSTVSYLSWSRYQVLIPVFQLLLFTYIWSCCGCVFWYAHFKKRIPVLNLLNY